MELPRLAVKLIEQVQIHVFTDASAVVCSATIYVLNYGLQGEPSLIFAKPLDKGITIVELLAILIEIRAAQFIIKQLDIKNISNLVVGF
uniref:RT_RNaseH_2 domain-containing protein n=1 Tax=Loa loa TaxID=7209 RepID=A0A1I7VVH3_LOALO